jgi:hypothetical protein
MGLLESGMLLFWPFIVVILIVGLLSFFTVQTAQVRSSPGSGNSCGWPSRA